jgi:hypothetical protein
VGLQYSVETCTVSVSCLPTCVPSLLHHINYLLSFSIRPLLIDASSPAEGTQLVPIEVPMKWLFGVRYFTPNTVTLFANPQIPACALPFVDAATRSCWTFTAPSCLAGFSRHRRLFYCDRSTELTTRGASTVIKAHRLRKAGIVSIKARSSPAPQASVRSAFMLEVPGIRQVCLAPLVSCLRLLRASSSRAAFPLFSVIEAPSFPSGSSPPASTSAIIHDFLLSSSASAASSALSSSLLRPKSLS